MSEPTISIIVPAWNEANYLSDTVRSIQRAIRYYKNQKGQSAELIVVNNNSSDNTAEIASGLGAKVVHEPLNNIARSRNAGARFAKGRYLAFCDADNQVSENIFCKIHDHLSNEQIVGGGTWIRPQRHNWKIYFFFTLWHIYEWISRVGVGLMHCRRDDFVRIGGYNESLYAAEDLQFAYDLKKLGKMRGQRFSVLYSCWITTSTRKIDQVKFSTLLTRMIGFSIGLQKKIRDKEYCALWYERASR